MNDLTVKIVMRDGTEHEINPLTRIVPHNEGIEIYNGSASLIGNDEMFWYFKISDIDKITITEMNN